MILEGADLLKIDRIVKSDRLIEMLESKYPDLLEFRDGNENIA